MTRIDLLDFYNAQLKPDEFKDFCPNGLQIEGSNEIKKISFAVSATMESIDACIENGSDTLMVHHGLFWNHQGSKPLTGVFGEKIIKLVSNKINLIAYHLPLDAHLIFGNAAVIAKSLGLTDIEPFGNYNGCYTGVKGKIDIFSMGLADRLQNILHHDVICSISNKQIHTVGIITGGASNDWILAKNENLDAFITGEINHHSFTDSQEADICMLAGGHEATEVFGILEMKRICQIMYPDIQCEFITSNNPV